MRIGILTHNYPETETDRRNAGIFVYDVAQKMQLKDQIVVYTPGEANVEKKIGQVITKTFPWSTNSKLGNLKLWKPTDLWQFLNFFKNGWRHLDQSLESEKFDCMIAMWAFPAGYFAMRAKKKYGIPYGIWALGSDIYVYAKLPLLKNLIIMILKNADFLMADGIDLAAEVKRLCGRDCLFVPSASELSGSAHKIPSTKKSSSPMRITFLGRMEKVKGPDLLVAALLKDKDFAQQFEVHMIGEGGLLDSLKQEAKGGKFITFHGNIHDPKQLKSMLAASDWVIIPSRSDSIPLVFSEAMSAGVPVLVSDLADLKYLIEKYQVGKVFAAGSVDNLVMLLKTLEKESVDYTMLKRNTGKASKDFSPDSSARQVRQLIQQYT